MTGASCIRVPGSLASNRTEIPSSGCTLTISRFGAIGVGLTRLENVQRRPPELNRDFGRALGQPLAGAQVEGHARPAPAVELQPQRDVGLGDRARIDPFFLPVARHLAAVDPPGGVLRADDGAVLALEQRLESTARRRASDRGRSPPRTRSAAPSRSSPAPASDGSGPCRAARPRLRNSWPAARPRPSPPR